MAEKTPDLLGPKPEGSLPDTNEPFGTCPRCERASNFSIVGTPTPVTILVHQVTSGPNPSSYDHAARVAVLQCMGCKNNIAVIEQKYIGGRRVLGGRYTGRTQWRGVHWWPALGMLPSNQDVPQAVADAVSEGTRCLAVQAPRAAVVMFRGALAEIVADKGSEAAKKKRNLKEQLDQMATDGVLQPALAEWAHQVRLIGNAGAHPSELDPVTAEESADLSRLLISILEYLYVMPAQVARRRGARTNPPSLGPTTPSPPAVRSSIP